MTTRTSRITAFDEMDFTLSGTVQIPTDAIVLTDYAMLAEYVAAFARGDLPLIYLLGPAGTGKSETIKRALKFTGEADAQGNASGDADGEMMGVNEQPAGPDVLYVEGQAQPYGLYTELFAYRDCPVVIDDVDRLYAKVGMVRLMKALCNTNQTKRLTWVTDATRRDPSVPRSFATTSNVILIGNEWKAINANTQALGDRAIILWFAPTHREIHEQVATWFEDDVVHRFIGDHLDVVPALSMRHYVKASQLRRAGFADWRQTLLQMMFGDRHLASVANLQADPAYSDDGQRVERFYQETGMSRATYYRIKKRLAQKNGRVQQA